MKFTTTAPVIAGHPAYITPSGKVSPHPGPSKPSEDTYGQYVHTKTYKQVGFFATNAPAGDQVEVLNAGIFKKTEKKPLKKPKGAFTDLGVTEGIDVIQAPTAEQAQIQHLNDVIESWKIDADYWKKKYKDLSAKHTPVEGQGKTPIGTPLNSVSTKEWKKKAVELSPLKRGHVFRKAEKLTWSIKESLAAPLPTPCHPEDANLISSEMLNSYGVHLPVLDIDMPCRLVPSSQPGHYHLYIDAQMTWPQYVRLLTVMKDVGILQEGFVEASIHRGFSSVRPPWVKKTAEEIAESKSD